ncbi:hypothetical protein D0Y65_015520 [Glycine soja]|uniref:Uncharacterized protein n=1 Tax=Glycine soja TaxID=3848 RepID=A0A445KDD7_GLYSO|nr:hypothetical protein D0Y65_015520 [Glycine soja]
MGSKIYPKVHENPRAFFSSSSPSLLESSIQYPWGGDEDFNSRSNSLKEGGDDDNQAKNKGIESIQRLGGPMTRACAKKSKEVLNQMVATLIEAYSHLEGLKPKLVNYIKQLEEIR